MTLPPPDISQAYIDQKTGTPSKEFYNWIKSLSQSGGGGVNGTPNWINAATDFGAVCDGVTDTTLQLQAAINAAIQSGRNLYIPGKSTRPGVYYRITDYLRVGTSNSPIPAEFAGGFQIFGDGPGNRTLTGGTVIVYDGPNIGGTDKGIFTCGPGAWRFCAIREMTLLCLTPNNIRFGVLVEDSDTSGWYFDRISCHDLQMAFGNLAGPNGEQNGEFYILNACGGDRVDRFWYTDNGQGYQPRFINCGALLNHHGVYFELGQTSGGGGVHCQNFDGSAVNDGTGNVSNTTLIKATEANSTYVFCGGRIEGLTCLWSCPSSSENLRLAVTFIGLQVGCDNDTSDPSNNINHWIIDDSHPNHITLLGCTIFGDGNRPQVELNYFPQSPQFGWEATLVYDNCQIEGIGKELGTAYGPPNYQYFRNTRYSMHGSHPWRTLNFYGRPIMYTVDSEISDVDYWVILNQPAGTLTLTLPDATLWPDRVLHMKTVANQPVASDASNVIPQVGGVAGTAILAGVAGTSATLVSNGTNWEIMGP